MTRFVRLLLWLAAFAFIVFLGFIVFFADTGTMPAAIHRFYNFPYGDKAGHFVLMGLLTLALNLAFSARRIMIMGKRVLLGSALAILVVTAEEITQVFFQTRSLSVLDLGASYLGIVCASMLIGVLQKRRLAGGC